MFRRPTVRYGATPEPETPYQRAGQVWDERIGSARVQAMNWRLAFFAMLALSGGLAAGLVWQSARGTVTPWVVQVDRLGQAQAAHSHALLNQRLGSKDHLEIATLDRAQIARALVAGDFAGQQCAHEAEPSAKPFEVAMVLLGEQFGRRHNHGLIAGLCRSQRRPERD